MISHRTARCHIGGLSRRLRREDGQVLPIVLFLFAVIIGGGLIVFWVGAATSQASNAQTAADAAALAGENTLVQQVDSGSFALSSTGFSQAAVCASASDYAHRNGAHVTSCQTIANSNSTVGYDTLITVTSDHSLSVQKEDPAPGDAAQASARASTDPGAQASPTVQDDTSCPDGSTTEGTPFSPHAGQTGFFAGTGTNYSYGCESRIAGALNELAVSLHLRGTGTSGYVEGAAGGTTGGGTTGGGGATGSPTGKATAKLNATSVGVAAGMAGTAAAGAVGGAATAATGTTATLASLHACGAISTTTGLGSVSATDLARFDLVRPFSGDPNEVELSGQGCQSTDSSQTQPVSSGNLNVHLVPLQGGPQSTFVSVIGTGGPASIGESALQVGCQIYAEWKSLNIPAQYADEALRVAFLTAADESDFGQNIGPNRTDPDQSIGVFQQISDDGWGTMSEEINTTTATALFFEGGTSPNGVGATGLLTHLEADPGLPLYELAQKTQGSGAGSGTDGAGNYGTHYAQEEGMYDDVMGGQCKNA